MKKSNSEPEQKNMVPIKIGKTTIYVKPDRNTEYIKGLYLIYHQPKEMVTNY